MSLSAPAVCLPSFTAERRDRVRMRRRAPAQGILDCRVRPRNHVTAHVRGFAPLYIFLVRGEVLTRTSTRIYPFILINKTNIFLIFPADSTPTHIHTLTL